MPERPPFAGDRRASGGGPKKAPPVPAPVNPAPTPEPKSIQDIR